MEMESTVILPSASGSVDSNTGPIELSSDDDSGGGNTNSNTLAAARKRKRLGPIYTCWNFADERTILIELADSLRESGRLPLPSELWRTLQAKGVLHRQKVTDKEVRSKIHNLKTKFLLAINNGGPGIKSRDQKLYELSKDVWPELLPNAHEII